MEQRGLEDHTFFFSLSNIVCSQIYVLILVTCSFTKAVSVPLINLYSAICNAVEQM